MVLVGHWTRNDCAPAMVTRLTKSGNRDSLRIAPLAMHPPLRSRRCSGIQKSNWRAASSAEHRVASYPAGTVRNCARSTAEYFFRGEELEHLKQLDQGFCRDSQ